MHRLAEVLAERERRALRGVRRAAILVPIIDEGGPRRLLLTRRAAELASHPGHVAFPGGGVDPGDDGVVAAALREAHEEVGLPPEHVDVLGLLDDFPTYTGETVVTPVVGRIARLPELVPEPGEVARIFSIPVPALRERDRWRTREIESLGRTWPMFYFDHDGETLWGLSAYVTLHLLELTEGGAPYSIPGI